MTRLRDHLSAPVDEARIERQWSALGQAGLPRAEGRSRRLVWVLAGALAMAAAFGLALQLQPEVEPAPQARKAAEQLPTGAVLESADAEVAVQLSDGSQVALAPRAQVRVRSNKPKVIELELQSGRARFDVRHDTGRRFAVQIGGAEVRVLGTRFELARSERTNGTFVQVTVREGVVEVEVTRAAQREVTRIHANESWSTIFPSAVPEPVPAPVHDLSVDTAEPEASISRPRKPARPAAATSDDADPASDLFTQATLARRAGRMREAADSYGELLERYPSDARSALSAFELGRLRMDALDDPAGAIDALERALKAGASASFREDALARIVVASDALGRTQQCLRARQRYAEQYPSGVHRAALEQRCQ